MDEKEVQSLLYDPYLKKPDWHSGHNRHIHEFTIGRHDYWHLRRRPMFADGGPLSYEMWLGIQYEHAMSLSRKWLRFSDYLLVAEDLLMDGTAWDWEEYDAALEVALKEHFPTQVNYLYFTEYLEAIRDGMYLWD